MPLQAIVFDMDDTLYPEREYVLSGFRVVAGHVALHYGLDAETLFVDLKRLFDEGVRGDTFNRWLALHDLSNSIVPALVRLYREHQPSLKLEAGVAALLTELRAQCRLALLSDGYESVQRNKFAALGLQAYFDVVLFTDALGRDNWKPSLVPFRWMEEQLGLSGSALVYVADNPTKDFIAPRQLGWRTVRLRRPDGVYDHIEPQTADQQAEHDIQHLDALRGWLTQLALNGLNTQKNGE